MAYTVKMFTGFEGGAHADGFSDGLYSTFGFAAIQDTIKRKGSYALMVNPVGANIGVGILGGPHLKPSAGSGLAILVATECYLTLYFRVGTFPAALTEECLVIKYLGTTMLDICLTSDKEFYVADGGPHALATSTTKLVADTWYLLEIMVNATANTYQLRIYLADSDDAIELENITGSAVQDWSGMTVSQVYLGKASNVNNNSVVYFFDDVVCADGGYISNVYSIERSAPSADGHYDQWSDTYAKVVDVPPDGDTSYCHPAAVGSKQSFLISPLTGSGSIAAVCSSYCMKRSYAGDIVQQFLRSNGTDKNLSSTTYLGSTYGSFWSQLETRDFGRGNVPWTKEAVEALEIGLEHKVGESGNMSRWTAGCIHVLWVQSFKKVLLFNLGG